MEQKTKMCIGINGCNKVLSIDHFGVNKATNDGLSYMCKVCARRYSRKKEGTEDQKRKKAIRMRRWQQTPEGKAAQKRAMAKYYKTEKGYTYFENYRKTGTNALRNWYIVHNLLKPAGILNPTVEMIEAKRQQMLLYREIYNKDGTAKFNIDKIK